MIKKTIEFVDYNGTPRKEEFYFNLSKTEVIRMELEIPGGLQNKINSVIASQDGAKIIELFDYFVDRSYGVKSADGRSLVKSVEALNEFKSTEAYSNLFYELVTNSDAASEFFNGIMPVIDEKVLEAAKKEIEAKETNK